MVRSRVLLFAACLAAAWACRRVEPPLPPTPPPAPPPSRATALEPVRWWTRPPLLDDGDRESLRLALGRSLDWLGGHEDERLVFGPREVSAPELAAALADLLLFLEEEPPPEALAAFLDRRFDLLEAVGGDDGSMLVTGYFEPVIAASRRRTADYRVPVYGRPPDLIQLSLRDFSETLPDERLAGRLRGRRLVPYPDRRAIRESGHLRGREIAWARDPVDLFFLEIQGSGTLRFPDGGELRIGYVASNGRPYRSIGRLLIDEGELAREEVSMQSIRRYLAENPGEVRRILDHNESVVFFRRLEGPPVGSLGVPVTAGRTVATDRRLFPPGALAFLLSVVPEMGPERRAVAAGALSRLVLNQDTGGAIRGPGRVDFFWGKGEAAAEHAGLMKHPGRLFFLLPKGSAKK